MNKYKICLLSSVSFGDEFLNNNFREFKIYAVSIHDAEIMAKMECKESKKNDAASIEISEEQIYRIDYLGQVQYHCSVVFRTEDGATVTPTNTVSTPSKVLSWLNYIFEDEARGYSVVTMKVEEVLIFDTSLQEV